MKRYWINLDGVLITSIRKKLKLNSRFVKTYSYLFDGTKITTRKLFKIIKIDTDAHIYYVKDITNA